MSGLNVNVKAVAIILAGGRGSRMNSDIPKQLMMLNDRPLICYALKAFEDSAVTEIILVSTPDDLDTMKQIVADYDFKKVTAIVPGGAERYNSVHNGLNAIKRADIVLIHDGARPFVTDEIINANIKDALEFGACITAVDSKDTVKISDADGFVKETPLRKDVKIVQTPQSFQFGLIKDAYVKIISSGTEGITDDAQVLERATGHPIKFTKGSYMNIKITTPEDLEIAAIFCKNIEK